MENLVCGKCPDRDKCPHAIEELSDDLEDIWQLWTRCRSQVRCGFSGAIGLDYTSVFGVAKILDFELTPWDMDALRTLECDMIAEANERVAADKATAKKNGG